jgi:hypothetical protein
MCIQRFLTKGKKKGREGKEGKVGKEGRKEGKGGKEGRKKERKKGGEKKENSLSLWLDPPRQV